MFVRNSGIFDYGLYRLLFLAAICMLPYILLKYFIVCIIAFLILKTVTKVLDHYILEHIDTHERGVVITGCDTGLGNRFARHLDEKGFTVFAGCLNKNSPGAISLKTDCSSRIHIVEINVTRQDSVNNAFTYIKNHLPSKGLWGVINNAGMDMLGELELTPISLFEKGFELNLYGYIRVMKTFLPLIRQSKGRVVNVSSVRGRIVEPGQSIYCTTKHAVETLSDSLRLEMSKFGVKVCIIEPGNFGNATAIASEAVIRRYHKEVDYMWDSAREEIKQSYSKQFLQSWIFKPVGGWPPKADSTAVAKAVAHALCSAIPKHRYLIQGKGSIVPLADEYVVLSHVYSILPTWIIDSYIALWRGCHKFNM